MPAQLDNINNAKQGSSPLGKVHSHLKIKLNALDRLLTTYQLCIIKKHSAEQPAETKLSAELKAAPTQLHDWRPSFCTLFIKNNLKYQK
ncbi:unnamed protein product [Allacma fusca]|uniref:Uncharacterized protein n=1 Tax=Allacma fusca TaxID=39272 RepID=A0A8J2JWB1_9HEXA|nr:unnamed protein product [Allacma fusca]